MYPGEVPLPRRQAVDLGDDRMRKGHRAMLKARGQALAAGFLAVGWKIGWNDSLTQQRLGIDTPALGFLLAASQLEPGETCSLRGTRLAGVEPEIAMRLARDVPPDATRETAWDCVADVYLCLEIIDINGRLDDLIAVLGSNIFHHGFTLAESPSVPRGPVLADCRTELRRDGSVAMIPVDLGDSLGHLGDHVRFVAATLGLFDEKLRAGDLVLSGLVTPLPVWVEPGNRVEFAVDALGHVAVELTA